MGEGELAERWAGGGDVDETDTSGESVAGRGNSQTKSQMPGTQGGPDWLKQEGAG